MKVYLKDMKELPKNIRFLQVKHILFCCFTCLVHCYTLMYIELVQKINYRTIGIISATFLYYVYYDFKVVCPVYIISFLFHFFPISYFVTWTVIYALNLWHILDVFLLFVIVYLSFEINMNVTVICNVIWRKTQKYFWEIKSKLTWNYFLFQCFFVLICILFTCLKVIYVHVMNNILYFY